jgi:GntR family transcriptional regulator/MocR family aminotransferase
VAGWVLVPQTGPVAERVRVREIDDDEGARLVRVAIEDPGWRWQRYTVENAGLEAVPVRVDADGMVISDLAAAGVDAVVMTPAHHYPTGVVMTAERRSALLAWAREHQALIVEDDYDAEYRFGADPMASLQGQAPDLLALVGTTSKTLAPALRLAWIVPPPHLIEDVENVMLVTGMTPPTLDQVALASLSRTARSTAICTRCAAGTEPSGRS